MIALTTNYLHVRGQRFRSNIQRCWELGLELVTVEEKIFWNLKHTAWWLEQRSTPLEEWELGLGFESEERRWRFTRKRENF